MMQLLLLFHKKFSISSYHPSEITDIKIINGVSPDHPTRKVFYQLACKAEGLTPPEFGATEGEQKIVHTRYPDVYHYQINNWLAWLNYMV